MKQSDIPNYIDPVDFETLGGSAKYPCSTNKMRYSALTHKYYLQVEALNDHGIDVENRYYSESINKIEEFIDEVTEDVYGAIDFFAPFNIMHNYCLVAQSCSLQFRDKYTARKQFEKALLYQAKYKIKNLDPRETSGIDYEKGSHIDIKTLRNEARHISRRTIDILDKLGLLFNGNVQPIFNYERYM